MRASTLSRVLGALTFGALGACAGGSGCGGCGAALPDGFPSAQTIANAGDVRITRSGLDFLSANVPALASRFLGAHDGIFTVAIPTSTINQSKGPFTAHITICPLGPRPKASPAECEVEVDIGKLFLRIDATTPHSIKLAGTIPIRLLHLPLHETTDNGPDLNDFGVGLGKTNGCDGNTPKIDWKTFPLTVTVPFMSGTLAPRSGYTAVDLSNLDIQPGVTKDDVAVCKSCSIPFCSDVIDFAKDQAFGSILSAVKGQLKGIVASQLCMKPGTGQTPCPSGTNLSKDGSICTFPGKPDQCVPHSLGSEGHFDLGSLLSGFSPGTTGAFDFALAAGGEMDPAPAEQPDNKGYAGHTANGLTLHMLGGALPSPPSSCVPQAKLTPPAGIPVPDEMRANTIAGWPAGQDGPHVGIALSKRFLDYTLGQTYNAGLLCLGISTQTLPQIQTGLVSLLVPSIKDLTFEGQAAPVAITTRPQKPPTVKLGGGSDLKTDPLLTLEANQFALDFYVWSADRYVRAFTFTADLFIPLNLQSGKSASNPKGGLLPAIGTLRIKNGVVTNADLLLDDPAEVASSLQTILAGLGGQFGGALSPIDLSGLVASSGLSLDIPTGAIRKLTKGNDDFLAVFGELGTSGTSIPLLSAKAAITGLDVDKDAMTLSGLARGRTPVMHVTFDSVGIVPGGQEVEFSYALDGSAKSPWSTARTRDLDDAYLAFQGKHVLHTWARLKDIAPSEDPVPFDVPYVVDVLPPAISLGLDAGSRVALRAHDLVSDDQALVARYRVGDAPFSDWAPVPAIEAALDAETDAPRLTVEVRDEKGNIGTISQPLIRGQHDPTLAAAGGCGGCGVGTDRIPGPSDLGAFALVVLGLRGRLGRRKPAAGEAARGSK